MTTERKGWVTSWRFAGFAAGLALTLPFLVTGCEPECADQFDCRSKAGPGELLACVNGKCVPADPADAGEERDAGTDAGVDGGIDAGPVLESYEAQLSASQEVPVPSVTTGSGTGAFDLRAGSDAGDYELSYTVTHDLGALTGAHLHRAPPGLSNPTPEVSLVVPNTSTASPITGKTILTPEQHQALQEGLLYVNLHTSAEPAGQVRGQLVPTGAQLFRAATEDAGIGLVLFNDVLKYQGAISADLTAADAGLFDVATGALAAELVLDGPLPDGGGVPGFSQRVYGAILLDAGAVLVDVLTDGGYRVNVFDSSDNVLIEAPVTPLH